MLWAFLIGILAGVVLDYLWRKTGVNKYEGRLEAFEHYHLGLALLIFMRATLGLDEASFSFAGAGIFFIFAEVTQKHPFAFKSEHQLSSTIIGIIFLVLLVLTWVG